MPLLGISGGLKLIDHIALNGTNLSIKSLDWPARNELLLLMKDGKSSVLTFAEIDSNRNPTPFSCPVAMKSILTSFHFLALICLVAGSGGCSKDPKGNEIQDDPVVSNVGGSNLHEYKYSELHQVEDFELIERDGQPFGREDLEGKVWVASFFFSTCKFECSEQNRTIRDEVHEKLAGIDFTVVSMTCDPQTDTPGVLKTYAKEFTTIPEKWKFLTGPIDQIKAIGQQSFKVVVDPKTHTKRLLLVDKWGKFRDSFEWKVPEDLVRLRKVAKMLAAEESKPAPDEIVKTRALPESVFQIDTPSHGKKIEGTKIKEESSTAENAQGSQQEQDPNWPAWRNSDWLTSFELTDSNGKTFRSEDMKGKVWIANFFFTSCTGACPRLLEAIDELRSQIADRDITFVSISNDTERDTAQSPPRVQTKVQKRRQVALSHRL